MAALHSRLEPSPHTEPYRTRRRRRRSCNRNIVLPGQTVFVSVRVVRRHYLLKPDAELKQAILYLLGHYAEKWGQEIYGFCFMSNHFHVVLRDPNGVRPKFFADFHRTVAQVVKAKYGWTGPVFTELSPPVVLHSSFAVADKIGYTLANPVAAGAVRYPRDWPGLISRVSDMGQKRYHAKRPEHFFGKRKTLPESSSFELKVCPWLVAEHGSAKRAKEVIQERVEHHVQRAQRAVKRQGWRYLGARRVERQSPYKRAKSYEVFGRIAPHFATIGLSREQAIAVKREFVEWQRRYDDCRERFLRGESVIWPAGTWAMVQLYGQQVEAVP